MAQADWHADAARKMLLNLAVAMLCLLLINLSLLVSDWKLGWLINTVAVYVYVLAALMAVSWPLYLSYKHEGEEAHRAV